MKIGLVGPTYQQRSLPFDAQRSINLFPVMDQMGKEVAALYSAPGKSLFATAGNGPIRDCFASQNGRAFVVSGDTLYEISSLGVATSRGTLNTSTGHVTAAENGTQLFLCDGDDGYTLTYSSNTFAVVSDVDFPSAGMVAYIDGYFVINENDTGKFYISALNDGTSWAALDFATAESSPDNLVAVVNAVGQLWLFGSETTEIWTNTGDSSFPFRRVSGAKLEVGILSPFSAVEIDNSVVWVGRDGYGQGIVYKAQGFSPMRISNSPIEKLIQEATSPESITAHAYQEEGNTFYILTGGGLGTTLVYDLTTQQWHERAHLNNQGEFETDLAASYMFAFGKTLVGDRRNGKVYELSMDYYSDGGDELCRERIFTHLSDEGQRIRYNALEVGFETGVGLTSGQGSDPTVSLSLSKDGARTWIDCGSATIGAIGQYQTKVEFRRLGIAEQMTFKIRITDSVKVAITGAYLK